MKEHELLKFESVVIGQASVSKEEAINMAGQRLLDGQYVLPEYLAAMQEREKVCTTYIGNGVAIPHGVNEAKKSILKSGISVIQFPQGVDFGNGNIAYLVICIAGKNDEHLAILANLAELISEEDIIKPLYTEQNKEQLYKVFTQQNN